MSLQNNSQQNVPANLSKWVRGIVLPVRVRFLENVIMTVEVHVSGSSDQTETVMGEVERYVMGRLYEQLFCPEHSEDKKQDLAIQKRIGCVLAKTIK